jgi:LPXTG-motif cell wall-anchored protein
VTPATTGSTLPSTGFTQTEGAAMILAGVAILSGLIALVTARRKPKI